MAIVTYDCRVGGTHELLMKGAGGCCAPSCGQQCVLCLQRQSTAHQTFFSQLFSPSSSASRAKINALSDTLWALLLGAASRLPPAPAVQPSAVLPPPSTTQCLSRPSCTCVSRHCFSPISRSSEIRHQPLCISLLPSTFGQAVQTTSAPNLGCLSQPAQAPCIL